MYLIRNQAYRKVPWVRIPPSPPKICFLPSTMVQKNTLKALVPDRSRGFFVFLRHCRTIKFKRQLGCGLPSAARLSGGKQQTIFQESCSTRPVQTAATIHHVSHISVRCDGCCHHIFWQNNVLIQICALIFYFGGPGPYQPIDEAQTGCNSEMMSKIDLFLHRYCVFAYGLVFGTEQKEAILFLTVPA